LKGEKMIRKAMFIVCMLLIALMLGCQEEKKSTSEVKDIKQTQTKELEYSIANTCEGCDTRMALDVSPREIEIGHNPGIDNQVLYLTVVDKEGKPLKCCDQPMRMVVRNNGKLALYCPHCGKLKPIAVKDGKVTVE
jgi:uncharacterized lipoprotein NlpE involved in copper resistance